MCRAITCKKCGRPSWAGCGAHVEQVLGDVPKSQRCQCKAAASRQPAARATAESGPAKRLSWLRR